MATVQLSNVSKHYGSFIAVNQFSVDVKDGEFLILLGPSGCGKTTTLRMLAGFIEPNEGTFHIGSKDITAEPPYRRNIGLVFQNYALFPHLSVFENVAFGLRRRKKTEPIIKERVKEALGLVQLSHLSDRFPTQLSGGQQQRVAIARALAFRPDILLLDEPLSNLDARLRLEVRDELRRLQQSLNITTIMVTHDQDEAMSVGDRLIVINQGHIQQIGTPAEIYNTPKNKFVASFIGRANFFKGHIADTLTVFVSESGLQIKTSSAQPEHTDLMIRPEMIELSSDPLDTHENCFKAKILSSVFLGTSYDVRLGLESGDEFTATLSTKDAAKRGIEPAVGMEIYLAFSAQAAIGVQDNH